MVKHGTIIHICPYGKCVVVNYDDCSGKYILRCWGNYGIFYASEMEIIQGKLLH